MHCGVFFKYYCSPLSSYIFLLLCVCVKNRGTWDLSLTFYVYIAWISLQGVKEEVHWNLKCPHEKGKVKSNKSFRGSWDSLSLLLQENLVVSVTHALQLLSQLEILTLCWTRLSSNSHFSFLWRPYNFRMLTSFFSSSSLLSHHLNLLLILSVMHKPNYQTYRL